jgi:hypothetical protein
MTQAFNLSQLANNLNTSGQLDATDGLTGLIANANLASSGTASSSTFLRGDRSWATVTQSVLQVKQAYKTDVFTTTSGSYVDITGLSVSITPSSTSSRILVCSTINCDGYNAQAIFAMVRNSTLIGQSTAGSSFNGFASSYGFGSGSAGSSMVVNYIDSPSTTSAITYKIQVAKAGGSGTVKVNQIENSTYGMTSAITVMEIV